MPLYFQGLKNVCLIDWGTRNQIGYPMDHIPNQRSARKHSIKKERDHLRSMLYSNQILVSSNFTLAHFFLQINTSLSIEVTLRWTPSWHFVLDPPSLCTFFWFRIWHAFNWFFSQQQKTNLSATLKLGLQISYIIFHINNFFHRFLSDNQGIVMLEIMSSVIGATIIALITPWTILTESFGDEQ